MKLNYAQNKNKMEQIKSPADLVNYLKQKQQNKITKNISVSKNYQARVPSA